MSKLDDMHVPWWNNEVTLPVFLENIARQMRCGDYSPSIEAVVLTMDTETGIVTIHRWGEPSGLLDEEELREVARLSRTTT